MRERKKTGVHGTLEMIPLAWKFNSKQLLFKTLNSRMNIIETRAILNIIKTDRKICKYRRSVLPVVKPSQCTVATTGCQSMLHQGGQLIKVEININFRVESAIFN